MYQDIAPISAESAESEPEDERLFAEPTVLPQDLIARGYVLKIRASDRMFAVSPQWGCTGTKTNIGAVISETRQLIRFLEWLGDRQAEQVK